jgi:hypothetical protein
MVYSRLVEGFGPYLYKSERTGETVKSIYLGIDHTRTRKPLNYTTLNDKRFKDQDRAAPGLGSGPIEAPKPEKPKLHIEHKTKEETNLTYIERAHLYALAKKYDIDRAEIDHKISYDENKEILSKMAKENAQDQQKAELEAEQYKGAYKDFIKNVEEDSEKWKDYF